MSKEKELLARVLTSEVWSVQEELQVEIKELLAQPEQEPSSDNYMYNKLKEDYEYLLSHPPKREPLSDKEITKNTPKLIHIGERLAFHAGVRFAERHHNIGGGE